MTNRKHLIVSCPPEERLYMIRPQRDGHTWMIPCLGNERFATEWAADKRLEEWLKESHS